MAVRKDLRNAVTVVKLLDPAARTTTQTSGAIDMSLYRRATIVINFGAYTDGTFTPSVTTGATSGGSFAADADAALNAFAAVSTNGSQNSVVSYDVDVDALDNRWLKFVMTAAGTTTGCIYGAVLVAEKRSK